MYNSATALGINMHLVSESFFPLRQIDSQVSTESSNKIQISIKKSNKNLSCGSPYLIDPRYGKSSKFQSDFQSPYQTTHYWAIKMPW